MNLKEKQFLAWQLLRHPLGVCILLVSLLYSFNVRASEADQKLEIINGELAGTKAPEVVRMQFTDRRNNASNACTAIRIGERHFLGAGHCYQVIDLTAGENKLFTRLPIQLYYGEKPSPIGSYPLDLRHTNSHPEFNNPIDGIAIYDIAVFAIKPGNTAYGAPPPDNAYIKALNSVGVSVNNTISDKPVETGQKVTFFGYGCDRLNSNDPLDTFKRFGSGTVSSVPLDLSYYFSKGTASGCYGDSGGAVFLGGPDSHILVGVISGAADGYTATRHARIDGKIGLWVKSYIETPIIDSHSTTVYKSLPAFKVYGYKLSAPGVNNTLPVFTYTWPGGSRDLHSTTINCPPPKPEDAQYICVDTSNLISVPLGSVGDLTVSRVVSINSKRVKLTSEGIAPIKMCNTTSPC